MAGYTELIGDPIAYENLGDVSAATSITEANLKNSGGIQAGRALIIFEDNACRYTINGTTPTNTNGDGQDTGMKAAAGDALILIGYPAIKNFAVIEHTSGSTAYVHVTIFA